MNTNTLRSYSTPVAALAALVMVFILLPVAFIALYAFILEVNKILTIVQL